MFQIGVRVRIHINIRLAHVLEDEYVSQVMDECQTNNVGSCET